MTNSTGIVMLDPTGVPSAASTTLAPRLSTLQGKTIGLLHNTKMNAAKVLDYIAGALAQRYDISVVRAGKESLFKPVDPETIAGLRQQCHAVITGVGD